MTTGSGTRPPVPAAGPGSRNGGRLLPALDDTFRRASAAGEPSETWLRVAGRTVRLRFAGPALAGQITPPFDHLTVDAPPGGEPDLEIRIWDDASAGTVTPIPDRPGAPDGPIRPGPSRDGADGNDQGAVYVYRFPDARATYEPGGGLLSVLDGPGRVGYLRVGSAWELPLRARTSPARTILAWWARGFGLQIVHASAAGTESGGVLMVGRAGSGKSTSALACLGSGLGHTADDCCLVSTGEAPWVHGLYATAKVARSRASWFPRLEAEILGAPAVLDDEALLHLAAHHADSLQPSFPLRAVLVPEIGAAETAFEPCSSAHALAALAPSTMFQFPGSDAGTLGRLADLVRRLPCYRLRLSPDVARGPDAIRTILEETAP